MPTESKFLSVDAICLPLDPKKAPSYAGFLALFPLQVQTPYPPKIANKSTHRGSQEPAGALWKEQFCMIKAILAASAIVLLFGALLPFITK